MKLFKVWLSILLIYASTAFGVAEVQVTTLKDLTGVANFTLSSTGIPNFPNGVSGVGSPLQTGISAKSSSYTITTSDGLRWIPFTCGASNLVATLPAASGANTGRTITISKVDTGAGSLEIAGAGATIDGDTSKFINNGVYLNGHQRAYLSVISDGTNWFVIDNGLSINGVIRSAVTGVASSATAHNLTSISVPKGIWTFSAVASTAAGAGNIVTLSISTTSATHPASDGLLFFNAAYNSAAGVAEATVGPVQITVAATTTYYAVYTSIAGGTDIGNITAQRVL